MVPCSLVKIPPREGAIFGAEGPIEKYLEYDSSRSYSTSQGQEKLEKHRSKDGLLEREDVVFVAGALKSSQER